MNKVYIGIGSNLGDKKHNLLRTVQLLKENVGPVRLLSSVYKTEPWGYKDQPVFLNQCLNLATYKTPMEILNDINTIEHQIGRNRKDKWDKRIIDIDILFYNNLIMDNKNLTIPHPYLHLRNFVLMPLAEINPALVHPVLKKTIAELQKTCLDNAKGKMLISAHKHTISHDKELMI